MKGRDDLCRGRTFTCWNNVPFHGTLGPLQPREVLKGKLVALEFESSNQNEDVRKEHVVAVPAHTVRRVLVACPEGSESVTRAPYGDTSRSPFVDV